MKDLTEEQIKEEINKLIDLKEKYNDGFDAGQIKFKNFGIDLCIDRLRYTLLKDFYTPSNEKHNLSQPLLKTA